MNLPGLARRHHEGTGAARESSGVAAVPLAGRPCPRSRRRPPSRLASYPTRAPLATRSREKVT